MIYYQLLIGFIGFLIASLILFAVNTLLFFRSKTISSKLIAKISIAISLIFTIGYCISIFVVEGEGKGTGLDLGFYGFLESLPLFLSFFIFFLIFTALPVSIAIFGIIWGYLSSTNNSIKNKQDVKKKLHKK